MQKGKEKEGSEALGKGEQKMKDNEIIKALECCSMQSYPACKECPYHDNYSKRDCISLRNADIKDLINRQKAEIERLQKAIKVQDIMIEQQDYKLKTAKSEARKEVAERLKKKAEIVSGGDYGFTYEIREDEIDNLLAEMEERE